ncbi:MAG: hypothetical protein K2Q06_01335 [Parvularculaceae bacterium]|nr:hypothetical protein [Parvularculaceae bacterium]
MIGRLAAAARRRPAFAILAAWAALVVFIAPHGEFSINDDWAYTFSVKQFLETGELRMTFWSAMTLVGQLALGAGWASVFGTSELAFRLFSASLAGAGLVAFFRLILIGGGARPAAAAATACLLAFPIFQASALSFMTDAPHLAMTTFAALAFARSFVGRSDGNGYFALGLVLLAVSLLIRQTSAALAIGVVAAEFVGNGATRRAAIRSVIVVATTFCVLAGYAAVMRAQGLLPDVYDLRNVEMAALLRDAARFDVDAIAPMTAAVVQSARIFGLFAAPLVFILVVDRVRQGAGMRYWMIAGLVAAPLFAAAAASDFRLAMSAASLLGPDGVGPRPIEPQAINLQPTPFLIFLSAIGSAVFGLFAAEVDWRRQEIAARFAEDRRRAAVIVMVFVAGAMSLAPYGLTKLIFFDRYVLTPGAFALAALAMAVPSLEHALARRRSTAYAAFVVAAAFGAILVHDAFAWHRARAGIVAEVVSKGVDPADIDAGFEHNMRHLLATRPTESMTPSLDEAEAKRRPYAATKRRYTNHEVVAWRRVGQILPIYGDDIYVLRRPASRRVTLAPAPSPAPGQAPLP